MVVFWIFRFVSSSVYYGLNFNTGNLAGNLYLNVFISGLVEIPALVYVVALNNRIGRRKITLSLMLLAGISCLAVLVTTLIGMCLCDMYMCIFKGGATYRNYRFLTTSHTKTRMVAAQVTNTVNQCIIYSIWKEHVTKERINTYKAFEVDLEWV